jgi:hypothetical protein
MRFYPLIRYHRKAALQEKPSAALFRKNQTSMSAIENTYLSSAELFTGFCRLPMGSRYIAHSSSTFFIVFAISLFVRGFMAKALTPAVLALSASTRA